MVSRRTELAAFGILAVITVIAAVILLHRHPADNPYLPKCPFHLLTGLHCPGCGATRAAFYLIHGQAATAFRYQPLFTVLLPVLFFLICRRLYELVFETTVKLPLELPLYRLIAVAVCVFFVLRNIPLECFAWLRPPDF
ncbi:MAG: DUF2752 domain-containing protein [Planctomycetaceae bacterium]|jgi:hypothetical protein|nr:DUF2752 domain-containing protein [Planctomycetaceae bacterium]